MPTAVYNLIALLLVTDGATAIELALVLPILLLLVTGILEYSLVMYASSVLEGTTVTAARAGKTGYPDYQVDAARQAYVYGILQNGVSGLLDPTQLNISSKSYATFSDIGKPEPCYTNPNPPPCLHPDGTPAVPGVDFADVNGNGVWDGDQGKPGLGDANEVVPYTVTYPWPIPIPVLGNVLGSNGVFTVTASALVKDEPFETPAPTPAPAPAPTPPTTSAPPTGPTPPGSGPAPPPPGCSCTPFPQCCAQ